MDKKAIFLILQASLLFFLCVSSHNATDTKAKRQIFREQVLPALGGKIPEEAFRSDRLVLNRLNKEGITVPDGVHLDARPIHKHPTVHREMPEHVKVFLVPENRYVPPEGRFHNEHPRVVDTTYTIREPSRYQELPKIQTPPRFKDIPTSSQSTFVHSTRIFEPTVFWKPISYYQSWNPHVAWHYIHEPASDYFYNSLSFLDNHQIIYDYPGFLRNFHRYNNWHYNVNKDTSVYDTYIKF